MSDTPQVDEWQAAADRRFGSGTWTPQFAEMRKIVRELATVTAENKALRKGNNGWRMMVAPFISAHWNALKIQRLKRQLAAMAADNAALRQRLSDVDFELSIVESSLHGAEGNHITSIRGMINQESSTH